MGAIPGLFESTSDFTMKIMLTKRRDQTLCTKNYISVSVMETIHHGKEHPNQMFIALAFTFFITLMLILLCCACRLGPPPSNISK